MLPLTFLACGPNVVNCLGNTNVGASGEVQTRCALVAFGTEWGSDSTTYLSQCLNLGCLEGTAQCWGASSANDNEDQGAAIKCLDGYYLAPMATGTTIDTYKSYVSATWASALATDSVYIGSQCLRKPPTY